MEPRGTGKVTPLSPDEKYAKLVSAYKKMKENNAVLKKAVIQSREALKEEKSKSVKISSEIKQVETKLRQVSEQNGLLKFHNNSLSKKVEALQSVSTETSKGGSSGGWFGGSTKAELLKTSHELDVAREELLTKITENEKLHLQLGEVRAENNQTVGVLTGKMKTIKEQLRVQQERFHLETKDFQSTLERATSARDELASKANHLQEELHRANHTLKEREETSRSMQQTLTFELQSAVGVIQRKLPFDDTKYGELNNLNVPSYDLPRQNRMMQIVDEAIQFVHSIFSNVDEYHKALHERLLIMSKSTSIDERLRAINRRMSGKIPDYSRHLKLVLEQIKLLRASYVENNMRHFDKRCCDETIRSVRTWVSCNKKLLSYHSLRLGYESAQTSCTPVLKRHNELLESTHKQMQCILSTLATYVTLALRTDDDDDDDDGDDDDVPFGAAGGGGKRKAFTRISRYNQSFILDKLRRTVQSMSNMAETFSSQLHAKIAQEHKDPFVLPALKSANERLLECWAKVSAHMARCEKTCGTLYDLVTSATSFPVRGAIASARPGALYPLEKRALSYMNFVHQALSTRKSPHIPYVQAVRNEKTIHSLQSSAEELEEQVNNLEHVCNTLREEKGRVHSELLVMKDSVAQKQALLNSLRAELVVARQAIPKGAAHVEHTTPEHDDVEAFPTSPPHRSSMDVTEENGPGTIKDSPSMMQNSDEIGTRDEKEEDAMSHHPKDDGGDDEGGDESNAPKENGEEAHRHARMESGDENVSKTTGQESTYSIVVVGEDGSESKALSITMDDKERERELRRFYDAKIAQLKNQLRKADGKAAEFHDAYRATEERLEEALVEKEKYRMETESRREAMEKAKKDLQFTTTSYEEQMRLLSEHVVSLNDKIVAQEETINNMKRREAIMMRNARRNK